jgi:sulfur carrier protein
MALELVLNGQPRAFAELEISSTIASLIAVLGLKADRVAIELNGTIAARSAWADTPLSDGDRVELVHFVGGGASS